MTRREKYKVVVKVVSQKGNCGYNHKVGDEWIIGDDMQDWTISSTTPKGICLYAFQSLLPAIFILMFGGNFPWESNPDVITNVACFDSQNPVTFRLERIKNSQ